jgi:pimeloyl-ACP methyl ester carboxylesterase
MVPHRSSSNRTRVLLLHGAFAGAWIWEGAFLDSWRRWTDPPWRWIFVRKPVSSFPMMPLFLARWRALTLLRFLIAHSLGALLAQRLLDQTKMAALVVLAPVPPEGMLFTTPFPLATEPLIWQGS